MQSGETPQANDPFKGIALPNVDDMKLSLQKLVEQGVINPEEAATIMADPSALNNIQMDPSLKRNQMDALVGLQDISDSGGMTQMDKANLSKISTDENTKARGQREAILQNAQARGLGGSGLELMSNLQNQQDSATRQSQRDLDVAGMAQNRALQALMQQGQLAGNIQNQDFSQKAQVANANDAISKFNAQNQQSQINQNVGARNTAQAMNLANKQKVADQNAALANEQQKFNKNLQQQNFNNQITRAGGQAGVNANNQAAAGQTSQNQADAFNKTIGTGLSAGATFFSDERGKTDVEEFSPSDFLDSLTSYKYKYKNPAKHGGGERVGVMAQDLEKSDAGAQMVSDGPEGKMVDFSKSGPTVLASLADINDRLRKLEGEG
jgi:hypothetical protein